MTQTAAAKHPRLQHFPAPFFAVVMGLCGLTLAWEKAAHVLDTTLYVDHLLAWASLAAFVVIFSLYAMKWKHYPEAVIADLRHPIRLSFVPAMSIGLILLGSVFLNRIPGLSLLLWMLGSAVHLGLTLFVISSWMHGEQFKIEHINPSWFIPAVGNVLVPIAGVAHGYTEVSWFFLSIGLTFWVLLFTLFFNRILFHLPMPAKLIPTLFILIAPPAVGFTSYIKLTGELDSFARILFYVGLFITLLLLSQIRRFYGLPFFLSWWAYSFPMAAMTIASFVYSEQTGIAGFELLGSALLTLTTALITVLLWKTYQAIKAEKICVPE